MPGHRGKVYLVGAGPGAADLLTLRAARLLAEADIVLHDALVGDAILALAARATKIEVGKRAGRESRPQRFINKRLIEAARTHRVVVRLKGGDPMMFGRAQEEIDALHAAGIEVEVVPGITAALASGAALRVSLTRRGLSRSVAFVTSRTGPGEPASDWAASLLACDTGVLYMGAGEVAAISRVLVYRGMAADTPVAVVSNASLAGERCEIGTLGTLESLCQHDDGPATIVIGEVLRGLVAPAPCDLHFVSA